MAALKNDDFRRLLNTPRVVVVNASRTSTDAPSFSHKRPAADSEASTAAPNAQVKEKKTGGNYNKNKKKPGTKKEADPDDLTHILKNYRDRAKERRVGENNVDDNADDMMKMQGGYHAVAPANISGFLATDRRKQAIEESKYLGGDMEHTHLVKGLDYALLQKVRSEIVTKEQEEDTLENLYSGKKNEQVEVETNIKSMMARNIYTILFKPLEPEGEKPKTVANELFAPKRMAYVMNVTQGDDEGVDDTDIPPTIMRSKQDCPQEETSANLNVNEVVIQKLTQVLSYLRADTKKKKAPTVESTDIKQEPVETTQKKIEKPKEASLSIYDDIGEYNPKVASSSSSKRTTTTTTTTNDKERTKSSRHDDHRRSDDRRERDTNRDTRRSDKDRDRDRDNTDRRRSKHDAAPDDRLKRGWAPADIAREKQQTTKPDDSSKPAPAAKPKKVLDTTDEYAECYPAGIQEMNMIDDSDEDADYLAMDKGNRRGKGPVGRFDFDNEEQYEQYMSNREANPKAAYQYGVKMAGGRKTGKGATGNKEKDGKVKLDREWNEISKILSKRKDGGSVDTAVAAKLAKY